MNRKHTLLFFLLVFFCFEGKSQCVYTSNKNGNYTADSTWTVTGTHPGGGSCGTKPSTPQPFGGASPGEVVNIHHTVTVPTINSGDLSQSVMQLNDGFKMNVYNGGTLDLGLNGMSTSWGNPTITVNTGGTLEMASLNFPNGSFSNAGTIVSTGDMVFSAGTISLAENTAGTSYITAPNIHLTSTSVNVTIDEDLEITGNLHANSGSTLYMNANTTISGYANFAGGQFMQISAGAYVEAPTVYVQNGSNLVVDGVLHATNDLLLGWTPSGAQSGSSYLTGTGVVGWGSLAIDNNENAIRCATGTSYGYCSASGSYSACSSPTPPYNPLDLTDCDAGVLPVTFVSFTGTEDGHVVKLSWTTSTEKNNTHFVVECYENNKWTAIETVPGAGNSDEYLSYTSTDYSHSPGVNYYRIKQVDEDGKSSFSSVIAVETTYGPAGYIYPQPLTGNFLVVSYHNPVSWSLISMTGTLLGEGSFSYSGDMPGIDFSGLPVQPGMYILQITTQEGWYLEKLVVESR